MDTITLVYIIIAFAVGVVVGWLTMVVPCGGKSNLTRDEVRRLNELIDKTMTGTRSCTVSLWSEDRLVDQVTVRKDW